MGFKKLLSTIMVCSLVMASLACKPADAEAADSSTVFNSVTLTTGYKSLSQTNPCMTQRYTADPGVMEYNGRVYVYTTNDSQPDQGTGSENAYNQINTLNCMSSSDMVNWTDHGTINVAGSQGAATWASCSWAPCAAHKTINGKEKFFLYFANNANGIGVLTSDSPTGPWTDPIGKALISRSTANCSANDVTWLFDPAVLVDTDGTGYLYFGGGVPDGKSENPKTARVVKLGSDMTSLAGTPITIDAPYLFEDSGINKIGNTYYYSYCTNWASRSSSSAPGIAVIAYMTSSSPTGPWTYQGTVLNNPGTYFGTTGNNHHTIIQFNNQWYIFYHAEWLNKQLYGSQKGYRSTHVDKLTFSDGKFSLGTGTLTGVSQLANVNPYTSNMMANMAWQAGVNVYGQGSTVVAMNKGDWTGISNVAFGSTGASSITMNAASPSGAVIKVCTGSTTGDVVGYVTIPATGSTSNYTTVTANINNTTGTKKLFFIASNDVVIDSWQFSSSSGTVETSPSSSAVGTVTLNDGWYYIKNVNAQKYLQVTDNTGKAGQNVEIGTGSGVAGQKWYLTNTTDGYITLTSGLGNYMLDVANASDTDGANIQIYDAYSGNAQKFTIQSTSSNGIYTIATKASNGTKMLDVYNFGTADGSNVCQWTFGGYKNQQWIFESTSHSGSVQVSPSPSPSPSPSTTPSESTGLPSGISCEYQVVSDWGSSFQGQITITNNSSQTYNGWTLSCNYNSTITSLWGAELTSQSGSKVVIKNPSWSAEFAPGSSVTINFIATLGSDKNTPTNITFQ